MEKPMKKMDGWLTIFMKLTFDPSWAIRIWRPEEEHLATGNARLLPRRKPKAVDGLWWESRLTLRGRWYLGPVQANVASHSEHSYVTHHRRKSKMLRKMTCHYLTVIRFEESRFFCFLRVTIWNRCSMLISNSSVYKNLQTGNFPWLF